MKIIIFIVIFVLVVGTLSTVIDFVYLMLLFIIYKVI